MTGKMSPYGRDFLLVSGTLEPFPPPGTGVKLFFPRLPNEDFFPSPSIHAKFV